jgi:hypothetical protein
MAVTTNDPQMARLAALANAINNEPNALAEGLTSNATTGTTELVDAAQVEKALTPPPAAGKEDIATQGFRKVLDGVNPRALVDYTAMAKNPTSVESGLLASFMLHAEQSGFSGEMPRAPAGDGPYVINLTGLGNTAVTVNIHALDLQANSNSLSSGVLDNLGKVQTVLENPSAQGVTAVTMSNNTQALSFTNSFGGILLHEGQITPKAYQAANKALVALKGTKGFGNEVAVSEDGFLYVALIKDGLYIQDLAGNTSPMGTEQLYKLGTVDKALERNPQEFKDGVARALGRNSEPSATEK